MQERQKILMVGESMHLLTKRDIERRYPVSFILTQWEDLLNQPLLAVVTANQVAGTIAHTFKIQELEQILAVHQSGNPIVAATSAYRAITDPELGWVDALKFLSDNNIPTADKIDDGGEGIFLRLYQLLNI